MNGIPLTIAQENQKSATEQKAVESRTPRSLRGSCLKTIPKMKNMTGTDCHGKEHVPFGKQDRNDKGDAGDRGNKDENIPEICNNRGEMLKPVHHYWIYARALLVFANTCDGKKWKGTG